MNEREIKFRYIWKRKSDGHFYVNIVPIECLELKGDQPFIHVEGNVDHWDLVSRDQFTGLKDAKGNDIYEGDIIKGYNPNLRHVIVWIEDQASVGCYSPPLQEFQSPGGIRQSWITEFEKTVIGNVHENQELLK